MEARSQQHLVSNSLPIVLPAIRCRQLVKMLFAYPVAQARIRYSCDDFHFLKIVRHLDPLRQSADLGHQWEDL